MMASESGEHVILVVSVVTAIVLIGGVIFLVFKLNRWYTTAAEKAQAQVYDGVSVSKTEGPGLVSVVFHTYYGVLVHPHQVEHRFWATPDVARIVLSRLNLFNMKWGVFARGLLFIPILSLGNYWAQRRSVNKQAARLVGMTGAVEKENSASNAT